MAAFGPKGVRPANKLLSPFHGGEHAFDGSLPENMYFPLKRRLALSDSHQLLFLFMGMILCRLDSC